MQGPQDENPCQITLETLPGPEDLKQIVARAQPRTCANVKVLFSPTSEQLAMVLQNLQPLRILSLSVNNILDPANVQASRMYEFASPEFTGLSLQN